MRDLEEIGRKGSGSNKTSLRETAQGSLEMRRKTGRGEMEGGQEKFIEGVLAFMLGGQGGKCLQNENHSLPVKVVDTWCLVV